MCNNGCMDARRQRLRRLQLDRQLAPVRIALPLARPSGGWVKSIREALGMSLDTLAHRLGVKSRSTIHQIERAELDETITVRRLRAAADALGCDLAIALIPRVPLTEMVESQLKLKVTERFARVNHSMVLESQAVYSARLDEMVIAATEEALENGDSSLWK